MGTGRATPRLRARGLAAAAAAAAGVWLRNRSSVPSDGSSSLA